MSKLSKIKLFIFTLFLTLGWLGLMPFASAQTTQFDCTAFHKQFVVNVNGKTIDTVGTLPSYCSLQDLIIKVINYGLGIAGLATVVFLTLGGFWLLTAGGNEEQSEKGRKVLTNAVIGLIVVIMSFAIVKIVTNVFTNGSGTTTTTGNSNTNSGGLVGGLPPSPDSPQFSGSLTADPAKPYTFGVTVPSSTLASYGCGAQPSGYMTVTKKDNTQVNLSGFSYDSGSNQLTGNFTTNSPTDYGYTNAGDMMHLSLYVCGQGAQTGWNVIMSNSISSSTAQCNPSNNDPTTKEDIKDCGGTEMTCSSQGICQDMSSGVSVCDPKNNDPQNNNLDIKDCGGTQTCNVSNQCVTVQNPNGNTTTAAQAAQNIIFTAAFSSDNKTIQINMDDSTGNLPQDKMTLCGENSFTKLINHPAQVLVDGTSAGSGTAADNSFTVSYNTPATSTKNVSVVICGQAVGTGTVAVSPHIR